VQKARADFYVLLKKDLKNLLFSSLHQEFLGNMQKSRENPVFS
jgi:hypothetical protein